MASKNTPWYLRVPFTSRSEPPPPPNIALSDAPLSPEATAPFLSHLTFAWLTPLLSLGYARTLQPTDLPKLDQSRSAACIAQKISQSFDHRKDRAEQYNSALRNEEIAMRRWRDIWWRLQDLLLGCKIGGVAQEDRERRWRFESGMKKPSLLLAMNDSIKWWFWSSAILKIISDTAQITSPLVVKAIITFATESYNVRHSTTDDSHRPPSMSSGIVLAIALFMLQLIASLCQHHFFYRSMSTGVLLRGGLIAAIYDRALKLTARARVRGLGNGRLISMVGTDVSRIDFSASLLPVCITAPIQILLTLGLLISTLGVSALSGFALLLLATPLQRFIVRKQLRVRNAAVRWSDERVKVVREVVGGVKEVKFGALEDVVEERVKKLRELEVGYIRTLLIIRAANNAVAFSFPILATVLAFITYSLTGHDLNAAAIFSSLTLFQLLRTPLMLLPVALAGATDAYSATKRLHEVFIAETMPDERNSVNDGISKPDTIPDDSRADIETVHNELPADATIWVHDAEFSWESVNNDSGSTGNGSKVANAGVNMIEKAALSVTTLAAPFTLQDVSFTVRPGQLCAVVGPVGSGKSSLMQALIGEMRRTKGRAVIRTGNDGKRKLGYCPQSAWIQNTTVRDNICFGMEFDEERYWRAVRDACLEADFAMLPYGDMTEVGEKGISLSGGQKQRVNICRAIYHDAAIQIYDDPLSALDAHVGKVVFQNVFLNRKDGTTRMLVTHALHFLPQVDYILFMVEGRIVEQGSYTELLEIDKGAFARFVREFDLDKQKEEEIRPDLTLELEQVEMRRASSEVNDSENRGEDQTLPEGEVEHAGKPQAPLMQEEEREVGAVRGEVYRIYLNAGRGIFLLPLLFVSLVMIQAANIMSSYWLTYWEEKKWPQPQGFYMAIYAGLGFFQAFVFFLMGSLFAFQAYYASKGLHRAAINRILHAPTSFFETTPLGRIMNRLSKDVDTLDNFLGDSWSAVSTTLAQILGAIILISIIFPWFLIPIAFISVCYFYFSLFYRASARELKRLDAILRSSLYAHFAESLTGLATIRAYGGTDRFRQDNQDRIDIENRAYWLTVANQRWLAIRLDLMGIVLAFLVALLAVTARFTISPAQSGIALTYILLVQQSFSLMVRQAATVENNMNSVERIVHYAEHIEQEAAHNITEHQPPSGWPQQGQVDFNNIYLSYRPGLPPVLKGLTMHIASGEKIGIVGRTGAGKSSIMTALYRLVELSSGSITIDGIDTSKIGLRDLRQAIAIIPQETVSLSGTLRSNLDPSSQHDDAELWDALKRSYLVEQLPIDHEKDTTNQPNTGASTPINRITLDTIIEDEGSNLSLGQRSLVSLARALVKDTRILVLDEATASVDYHTDKKIQSTIAREFKERTILCIAHRLHTIISYDRICVLDVGCIAELDTPINLYLKSGIFRSMCDESAISLEDIQAAKSMREALSNSNNS